MSTLLATITLIVLVATTVRLADSDDDVGNGGSQGSQPGQNGVVGRRRRRDARPYCETTPSTFTEDMINVVLKEHNDHRADEGGANIELIKWSELLADMGQAATDQCDFSHFNYKCNNKTFGQNIAMFNYDVSYRLERVVDAWYRERENYDFSSQKCEEKKVCGHYLQMVLAPVSEIGCGITKCDSVPMPDGDWTDSYVIFCNYNHIVMKGQSPYLKGKPCSYCQVAPGYKCVNSLCERCDPASDADCNGDVCPVEMKDRIKEKKCKKYKKRKYCEKKKRLMRLACSKTCDLCPVDLNY